jgi:uncharacterized protein (TIGR00255 family)
MKSAVRSMTGFARVRRLDTDREVVASVKSVNHRGLDVHFRMAPELDAFENALRAAVKRHVARGHIQVQLRYTSVHGDSPATANLPLLETYLEAFHRIAAVHGLHGEPDLNLALQIPGMFQPAEPEPDTELEGFLATALEEALVRLNEFRAREGAEIAAEMRQRNRAVLQQARNMEELRSRAGAEFQARLRDRLTELLGGVGLEPQRLAQEAAYLAERSDISEELTRLKVHAVQLEDLLEGGGEVGKKLDFLLQEMQRETNTILSKSNGVGETGLEISDLALAAKAEIEKIREQGLNLE